MHAPPGSKVLQMHNAPSTVDTLACLQGSLQSGLLDSQGS